MTNSSKPGKGGLLQLVGVDVLLRHWRPFALAAVITPLAAGVAHFILPQTFVSESRVLIKLGREFMGPIQQSGRSTSMYRLNEAINSEVEILSSRELAGQVVDSIGVDVLFPEIAEDDEASAEVIRQRAAAALLASLSTAGVTESSVIRIALAHEDRDLAKGALEALMSCFQARHLRVFSGQQLPVADEAVTAAEKSLKDAEESRAKYREQNGIFDTIEERSILLRRRDELSARVEDLKALRSQIARGNDPGAPGADTAVAEDDELVTLRAEEQRLLENYHASSHAVRAVRMQIESREKAAAERLTQRLSSLEVDEQRWLTSLDEIEVGLRQIQAHSRSLRDLDRAVVFGETRLRESLGAREAVLFDAKLDAGEVTSVVVIDRPTLPLEPLGIGFVAKLIVGLIAGLFLGGSLVILLHLLGRRDEDQDGERLPSASDDRPSGPTALGSIKLPS